MELEFVDFYPEPPKKVQGKNKIRVGTAHIYVIDLELDLRGIHVLKSQNKLHYGIPWVKTIDISTCKNVSYPIFSFLDKTHNLKIIKFLEEVATPQIEKILKDPAIISGLRTATLHIKKTLPRIDQIPKFRSRP